MNESSSKLLSSLAGFTGPNLCWVYWIKSLCFCTCRVRVHYSFLTTTQEAWLSVEAPLPHFLASLPLICNNPPSITFSLFCVYAQYIRAFALTIPAAKNVLFSESQSHSFLTSLRSLFKSYWSVRPSLAIYLKFQPSNTDSSSPPFSALFSFVSSLLSTTWMSTGIWFDLFTSQHF